MTASSIDYLSSANGEVHVINATVDGPTLDTGVLCVISFAEAAIRISNEQHSFLVELPEDMRTRGERLKAFNVPLTILNYEQVQLPTGV